MRIAIDAMGGDQAPAKILDGALESLSTLEPSDQIILVGDRDVIRQYAGANIDAAGSGRILIEQASQVITMDDSPVEASALKRDSSIVAWSNSPKTAPPMPSSPPATPGPSSPPGVLMLKPLAGADRPGIAVFLPSTQGAVMLCDAGANMQPKPSHLYQYARHGLHVRQGRPRRRTSHRRHPQHLAPRKKKAPPWSRKCANSFKKTPPSPSPATSKGRDLPKHPCDVVITDGFTGNVVLQVVEGLVRNAHPHAARRSRREGPQTVRQTQARSSAAS